MINPMAWVSQFATAMQVAGILAQAAAAPPTNVEGYTKYASQVALAADPKLASDATFQMIQQSMANIDLATATQTPGEVGKSVGFRNSGVQMYLHFVVSNTP